MSRYYDYDYDRGCIIGFGPDQPDLDEHQQNHKDVSPISSQSSDSPPPPCFYGEDDNDDEHAFEDPTAFYILEAHPKDIEAKKLKPFEYDVPFLLVGDLLKRQEQEEKTKELKERTHQLHTAKDSLSIVHTDKNLLIQRGDYETLQRFDDYNGRFYNTFGSTVVHRTHTQLHTWRLQIMGNAPAIIGIVESTAEPETTGAYFGCDSALCAYSFNTITAEAFSSTDGKQPVYQSLLKCGRLDEPMIIDVVLDLARGSLSILNQTTSSRHFGKELVLFDDGAIDTDREYKLGIALLGPEVVNLF